MMTIQDWIDYLKWHLEILQQEHQTNWRTMFGLGVVLVGSILAIANGIILTVANGIYSASWIMIGLGIAGVAIFGCILNWAIDYGSNVTKASNVIFSFISRIMLGEFKDSNEITEEYRRLLDVMKKYRLPLLPG